VETRKNDHYQGQLPGIFSTPYKRGRGLEIYRPGQVQLGVPEANSLLMIAFIVAGVLQRKSFNIHDSIYRIRDAVKHKS